MRENRYFVVPVNILTPVCARPVFLGCAHFFFHSNSMQRFTVDLKTFLGLAMPREIMAEVENSRKTFQSNISDIFERINILVTVRSNKHLVAMQNDFYQESIPKILNPYKNLLMWI